MAQEPSKAELILQAAQAVLLEEGFSGTTIAKVAAKAGVSRGLLHYYFRDKEDLFAQVLRRHIIEGSNTVERLLAEAGSVQEFAETVTDTLRAMVRNGEASLSLLGESLSVARTHPRVMAELADLHQIGRRGVAREIRGWKEKGIPHNPAGEDGLATILMAMLDGMILQIQVVDGLADRESTWEGLRFGIFSLLAEGAS